MCFMVGSVGSAHERRRDPLGSGRSHGDRRARLLSGRGRRDCLGAFPVSRGFNVKEVMRKQINLTKIGLISGFRLHRIRRAQGLSLRDLAIAAEVSAGYLCRIEGSGRCFIGAGIVRRLAKALKVKVQDLGEIIKA